MIGDFNHWGGNEAPMRVLGSTGRVGAVLARLRAPAACTSSGCTAPTASVTDRADPMAFATEVPPQTASRVTASDYTLERRRRG